MKYPCFIRLSFSLLGYLILVGAGRGQSLNPLLHLESGKLTGVFFGGSAAGKESEALSLTLDLFLRSSKELQLIYVGPAPGVSQFNRFRERKLLNLPTDPATRSLVSKSFSAHGQDTQIGRAIIGKFKVSNFPSLWICDASLDRVLDGDGLSTINRRSDPYGYWQSLASVRREKEETIQFGIKRCEESKLLINNTINEFFDHFESSVKKDLGNVDINHELDFLEKNVNGWFVFAQEMAKYADSVHDKVVLKIRDAGGLGLGHREKVLYLRTLDEQKAKLLNYRDDVFLLIFNKKTKFKTVLEQCNVLLETTGAQGPQNVNSQILKKISDFQYIHFLDFK